MPLSFQYLKIRQFYSFHVLVMIKNQAEKTILLAKIMLFIFCYMSGPAQGLFKVKTVHTFAFHIVG